MNLISDEQLKRHTVMVMELLATSDLQRDFDRAARAANAMLHEFHKEVSDGVLNAVAINLALGAFALRHKEQAAAFERLFKMLQNDRALFEITVHLAAYCEVLAPALKRAAELIQEQIRSVTSKTVKTSDG